MEKKTTPVTSEQNRDKVIIRTSIIGILTNVLLAGFKAVIGIISNSIAVTLDAVNNLSDALSSIITIVGTKLAGKLPDKFRPNDRNDRGQGIRQIINGIQSDGDRVGYNADHRLETRQ